MQKINAQFKRKFLTGLASLLPTLLTVFIIVVTFRFLNNTIGMPLGKLILVITQSICSWINYDPSSQILGKSIADIAKEPFWQSIVGFPISLILLYIMSYFLASFIGKKLLGYLETIIKIIPVIKNIYPYAKQFTGMLFKEEREFEYKKLVFVPWPSENNYALGFVTSEGLSSLNNKTGKQYIGVFIPNSPTPITGFVAFFERKKIIPCSLSMDEGIRFIVSGGVIVPGNQKIKLPEVTVISADEDEDVTTRLDDSLEFDNDEKEDTQKMGF